MKKLSCLSAVIVAISLAAACYVRSRPMEPGKAISLGSTRSPYSLVRIPSSAVHHQQGGIPRIHLWDSTSGNWSGYAVPQTGADTFSDVRGTWQIPTVTGSKRSTSYSSIWVGLDGYANATVEQIGTEQDWTKRGQRNYAWFEMYPSGAYLISGFPVNPGDSISAQVQYEGNGVFQLTINNTTRGASFTVPSNYTISTSATRQSAEWIVEAPWSGRVLPLADFGTVNLSGCNATSTGSSGNPETISFWRFDPLTMIDPSGGRAVPSSLSFGGADFSVQWFAR